jgi:imidazolonepropionase-like amidohydrolase
MVHTTGRDRDPGWAPRAGAAKDARLGGPFTAAQKRRIVAAAKKGKFRMEIVADGSPFPSRAGMCRYSPKP